MLNSEEFAILEQAVLDYNANRFKEAYDVFIDFATQKDEDESQFYLGLMYENGEHVEKDFEQAMQWWKKAAANRNQDAAFRLESISMTRNTRY